jgi:hypothetical protein
MCVQRGLFFMLCPELTDKNLPRLATPGMLTQYIKARVDRADTCAEHDTSFVAANMRGAPADVVQSMVANRQMFMLTFLFDVMALCIKVQADAAKQRDELLSEAEAAGAAGAAALLQAGGAGAGTQAAEEDPTLDAFELRAGDPFAPLCGLLRRVAAAGAMEGSGCPAFLAVAPPPLSPEAAEVVALAASSGASSGAGSCRFGVGYPLCEVVWIQAVEQRRAGAQGAAGAPSGDSSGAAPSSVSFAADSRVRQALRQWRGQASGGRGPAAAAVCYGRGSPSEEEGATGSAAAAGGGAAAAAASPDAEAGAATAAAAALYGGRVAGGCTAGGNAGGDDEDGGCLCLCPRAVLTVHFAMLGVQVSRSVEPSRKSKMML